jgi:tetratricopeptide (TPR) repeat protein
MTSLPAPNLATLLAEAQAHQKAGRLGQAFNVFVRCAALQPQNPMLLAAAGSMASKIGKADVGAGYLERATQINPANPSIYHDLCLAYRLLGRYDDAHQAVDRARELNPANHTYVAMKAELYQMVGDVDQAWRTIEPVLASAPTVTAVAIQYVRLAAKQDRHAEAIAAARQCLTQTSISHFAQVNLLFGIAALLDDQKQDEAAFEAYERANRAARARWDPALHASLVTRLIESWTPQAARALPVGDAQTRRPIFIVGMPRSGTTLVEQMLSILPGVHGAGELNDISFTARGLEPRADGSMPFLSGPQPLRTADTAVLAKRYLERLSKLSADASYVTDKLPTNFLNIGLILTLFPRAAIVHCRRNPMDVCVSCFTQHFDGNLSFTYDLANCAAFYREYERLMAHWMSVYPASIVDVVYEDLVADPEPHARRVLEHVGLPWNDACLRFHENERVARTASIDQVRQKLYTSSVGRYRRFDPWLGSLRSALGVDADASSAPA